MNGSLFRKYLVIVIISLILGIAFKPCVAEDNPFFDPSLSYVNEPVELTVEIFGIEGVKQQTVKLSREEIFKVEGIFNDLRNKLNVSITREETIRLFNETVLSLHEYGLLPSDIDIIETRQVVTGMFHDKPSVSSFNNLFSKHQEVFDENHNYLCLIAGKTNRTIIPGNLFTANYLSALTFASLSYLCYINGLTFLESIFDILLSTFFIPTSLLFIMSVIFSLPLSIGGFVTFGYRTSDPAQNHYYPSQGWVWTNGLNGIKDWNDTFVGDVWFINSYYPPQVTKYYVGALGFTGIKIGGGLNRDAFFLGTTLQVGFDTDYPYP
ncbi:MAG: hypothetical protein KAR64_05575 [Thermoplasmatales archaeon]|nr:hypothetical protein [Thermoplasmatales archaeon]